MDEFDEDVTRLALQLDDVSEAIELDKDLASHKAMILLGSSITRLLTARFKASISSLGEMVH